MTTPTHAETARAIIKQFDAMYKRGAREGRIHMIVSALTAAHAQGWDECVEACASALCKQCANGNPVFEKVASDMVGTDMTILYHVVDDFKIVCYAAAIRALKGGPK